MKLLDSFLKQGLVGLMLWPCLIVSSGAVAQELVPNPADLRPALPEFVAVDESGPFTLPEVKAPVQSNRSEAQFFLSNVRYQGNTLFTETELNQQIARYIGRPVSVSELEAMRIALTQFYIAKGYINSGVILPDQTAQNGIIVFQVIEGRLNSIALSGMDDIDPHYITGRLLPDNSAPFHLPDFQERYQLLLNDPLFDKFDGRFRPGIAPGESILDLTITPATPYGLELQLDNYGSASSGEEQLTLNGYYLNWLGHGDTLSASVRVKEGSVGGNLMYQLPMNQNDTRLTVQLGFNDSDVIEQQIAVLDIESDYQSTDISISHPLLSSLNHALRISASLSVRENRGSLLDQPFSFASGENNGLSRVSAVRVALQGSIRSAKQVWSGHLRYSQGITAFYATDNDNLAPDSDFSALLLQLQYARLFAQGVQLTWRADAQISSDGLLPLEQFALGGARSVRGYRENELVRDEGFVTSLQINAPLFDDLDYSGRFGALQGYIFMDYGEGNYRTALQDSAEPLWSAGLGLLWQFSPEWQVELVYGHAINTPQDRANHVLQDDGIHMRISGELL
ncbi:ShlB/FhaC/HecB family hemolysin secretion/activation protein [Planctobacterium marinum]|uniref:ShlB/FhaC/HecB family hemolysin secretion/activation protein n=1 Tax=Planctobacterium marinum TaxID=1631968 RepID=UPI001E3A2855|nr:ShlB/FhaC/HecB family hemolysin secretion/activation protein [Planctobacterium marinum]MCC2607874.1 BamA/TamA family outer membrane protein [Planctobacterium marinum]